MQQVNPDGLPGLRPLPTQPRAQEGLSPWSRPPRARSGPRGPGRRQPRSADHRARGPEGLAQTLFPESREPAPGGSMDARADTPHGCTPDLQDSLRVQPDGLQALIGDLRKQRLLLALPRAVAPLKIFSSSASSTEGPGDSADDRHRRVTAGAPHWQLRLRLSLGHDTRSLQESVRPPHPTGPWRGGTRPGLCGPVGRWARSLHAAARGTSPQGHGLPGLLCLVSREQPRAPLWPSQAWLWGALGGTPQPSLSQGHTRPCRAGSELPTPGAHDPRGLQGPLGWGGPAEPVSTLGGQLVPPPGRPYSPRPSTAPPQGRRTAT